METAGLEIVMENGRACRSTFVQFRRSVTLLSMAYMFLPNYYNKYDHQHDTGK